MNTPKVSIIIPIYKVERYLRQCLESACSQTLEDIEIICVNDGSPDNCAAIIDEFAQKDQRIKPIHKKNGGYASAVNTGLKIATGEYVAIFESDDYITEDYYYILYHEAIDNNLDVCKTNSYMEIREYMPPIFQYQYYFKDSVLLDEDQLARCLSEGYTGIWLAIYKRSFIIENNIYLDEDNKEAYQDVDFVGLVCAASKRMKIVETYGYNYRRDVPGQSVASTTKGHCVIKAVNRLWEKLDNTTPSLPSMVRSALINYSLCHLIHAYNKAKLNNLQTMQSILLDKIEQLFINHHPKYYSFAVKKFAESHHLEQRKGGIILQPSKIPALNQYPSVSKLQKNAASYAQIAALFHLKTGLFLAYPTHENAKLIRDDLLTYLNVSHQPNKTLLKIVKQFFNCSYFFNLLHSYPEQFACFFNFCSLNGEAEAYNTLALSNAFNNNLAQHIARYPKLSYSLKDYPDIPIEIKKSSHIYKKMLKSEVSFLKYIEGKTIAVVGNAPTQTNKNTGTEIDSHDIVIRFNNYVTEGYEDDYGKKTDVWATSPVLKNLNYRHSLFNYDFVISPETGTTFASLSQQKFIYEYLSAGGNYLRLQTNALQRRANVTILSMGLVLAAYLIENKEKIKHVNWYGFAFNLDKGRHYFEGDPLVSISVHNWAREKALFEDITNTSLD